VYNLKITELTAQRDMPSLIKILLRIPGLKPEQISRGLKVPPLSVFSTERGDEALKLKSVLEKFGAMCVIENTEPKKIERNDRKTTYAEVYLRQHRHGRRRFRLKFYSTIFVVIGIFAVITSYDFSCERKAPNQPSRSTMKQPKNNTVAVAVAAAASPDNQPSNNKPSNNQPSNKTNNELKKSIEKNPYNAEAWKNLADNLEKQGDTTSARQAKESYDRAVKTQMVLASLAKAFGNKVRVEIREDAVYYRTAYDFTDEEFDKEAERLMDSLSVKFPGKNLIIENYTSKNQFQSAHLKSKNQPKENDSPR